jgi:hypothetical protein
MVRGRSGLFRIRRVFILAALLLACSFTDNLDELTSGAAPGSAGGADPGAPGGAQNGLGGGGSTPATAGTGSEAGGTGGTDAGGVGGTDTADSGAGGFGGTGTAGSSTGGGGSSAYPDAGLEGASRIFWLERGSRTVNVINVDGSGRDVVLAITGGAPSNVTGIAFDAVGANVYFTDELRNRVTRVNLDGSVEQTVLSGVDKPFGIDIDPVAGMFYVSQQGTTPRIQRANLDGSNLNPLITATLVSPYGLALHAALGKLYVVDDGVDAVFSLDIDGQNLTNLNIAGVSDPLDVSIDTLAGQLYWSERTASGPRIRRANLDGSGVEDIVSSLNVPGFSSAAGVEVDVAGRTLYFVDGGAGGSILRCSLDGGGVTTVLGNLDDPTGVTLNGP